MIITGNCLEVLPTLEECSVDSLVTDPPAGIGFMGKDWDSDKGGRDKWIAWLESVMREAYRVLKPGAHGLVWAIPRTSHWTGMALENAGFDVRDRVSHLFGQGFPKSHSCKAIGRPELGSALKPACEDWWLIRRPLEKGLSIDKNVLKWGTGGINIDGCRIEPSSDYGRSAANSKGTVNAHSGINNKAFKIAERDANYASQFGRFPSHLILSHSDYCTDAQCDIECAIKLLDEQSGVLHTHAGKGDYGDRPNSNTYGTGWKRPVNQKSDSGGASRFFYCAKPSKREKNAGTDLTVSKAVGARPKSGDLSGKFPDHDQREREGNFHPTVKSVKLMKYLITMVTPPGGVVLDPFLGSGTTGVAALELGMKFTGIEQNPEYVQIAEKRIYSRFPEMQKQYAEKSE